MTSVRRSSGYNYEDYVPVQNIVCPICDSPCSNLQALNVHLDTTHTEEDTTGALLSWFRNAHKKVQTTLGSSSTSLSVSPRSPPSTNGGGGSNPVERSLKQLIDPAIMNSFSNLNLGNGNPIFFASDQDRQNEFVTRDHWQREGNHDACSLPGCGKRAGKQHCRHCGKLFCDPHMQYEMKLDSRARHDPVNGIWCRVCRGCYIGRPGYIENGGVTRRLTDQFLKKRSKTIDRVHLESNRLEKRLEKLARVHHCVDTGGSPHRNSHSSSASLASISLDKTESTSSKDSSYGSVMSPRSGFVSNGNSILSMKLKYRDGEQTVTRWEDDKSVTQCPFCSSTFTITNRKHHCRLCGRIVCGNIKCSKMIPLFLNMSSDYFDEEPVGDTRACRDCQRSVFRRKLRHEEAMHPMPIIQLYHQLTLTREKIEKLLPRFHDIIVLLDKEKISSQSQEIYQTAGNIRKSLLDNFALYDTLAKSIKGLPARSPSFRRLQANVCISVNMYLQQNMLPLQMLPRILKSEKYGAGGKSSSSPTSSSSSLMKKQDLQLQLQAFQEQEKLVEGFIRDAQHARKFDDVKTLKISLTELHDEMARIRYELSNS